MLKIITKELEFDKKIKQKIESVCNFCNIKPTIINGNIRNIAHSNLSYIEPHRVIIKGITLLIFNYSKDIYIGNLSKKIELKDLMNFIKQIN